MSRERRQYSVVVAKPSFRAGVITVVRRADGCVLAFERVDTPGSWQLPQGGIDDGESPRHAAWRELGEETGLGPEQVRLVDEYPHWTVYEWPAEVAEKKAPHRVSDRLGQAHKWFIFEPLDEQVDLEPRPDGVEFGAWKWVKPADLIDEVVEFRRHGYEEVLGSL